MATTDESLENFDEEPLEEEVDEDDETSTQETPQETAAAPKAAKAKQRKQRNDKGGTHRPPGEGWNSREAELLWPEILQRIPKMVPPKTPYDIDVNVVRFSPGAVVLPGKIDGSLVAGGKGMSPGDALRLAVEDYYHIPAGRGPEDYELRFVWKTSGRIIGRGRLSMPSSEEIIGLRRAQANMRTRRPYGGVSMPVESPYDEYGAEETPMAPPPRRQPVGVGAAPAPVYPAAPPAPAAGFGADGEVGYLRQQVGYLSGQLQQLIAAGLVPPSAAPVPPAPQGFGAAPPDNWEERMVGLLRRLGVVGGVVPQQQPQAGVGAMPQVPQAAKATGVASELQAGVSAFKTVVGLGRELRQLARDLNEVYGEPDMPNGETPEPPLVAEPVVQPPKPEDSLPFEVVPIPETSFLGHPAKYAIDKETGSFSREGFLMANPGLAEKALELGGKFMEALGNLTNKAGMAGAPQQQQQPAQVVREIPKGAVDASVAANNTPPEGAEGNGGL